MAQETNQTPGPMLCSTGCGFYGNPRTNGMCSVCYKEHLQRQQNSGRMSPMGKLLPSKDSAGRPRELEGREERTALKVDRPASAHGRLHSSSVLPVLCKFCFILYSMCVYICTFIKFWGFGSTIVAWCVCLNHWTSQCKYLLLCLGVVFEVLMYSYISF